MTKIQVILHTPEADVVSTYGPGNLQHALSLIQQYTTDGKSFSVKQSNW
jgi:hypothetical protein